MGVDNGDGTFSTRDPLTGSTVTIGLDEEDGHNTQWAKHIEKIRQLNILRSKFVHPIMEETTFTRDDVGKIFVINPEKNAGRLMTNEEFIALNISEIGEWEEVSIIDIPPHA